MGLRNKLSAEELLIHYNLFLLHCVASCTYPHMWLGQFLFDFIKIATNLKALEFLYYFGPNQHIGDP